MRRTLFEETHEDFRHLVHDSSNPRSPASAAAPARS